MTAGEPSVGDAADCDVSELGGVGSFDVDALEIVGAAVDDGAGAVDRVEGDAVDPDLELEAVPVDSGGPCEVEC